MMKIKVVVIVVFYRYIPSIAETSKFRWAMYFSLLVVLLYIATTILKNIYRYAVFSVTVKDNLPESLYH